MAGESVVWLLTIVVLTVASSAQAQQEKRMPRIAYLSTSGDEKKPGPQVEAFRRGLGDLGYIEGRNIVVEYRYLAGNSDVTTNLVNKLVQLRPDVLVLGSQPSIRAAKQATTTIPIVMVTAQDPVAAGFVTSLSRPGGNITGITRLTRELSAKRLELLKEAVPDISRVAALMSAAQTTDDFNWYKAPARAH